MRNEAMHPSLSLGALEVLEQQSVAQLQTSSSLAASAASPSAPRACHTATHLVDLLEQVPPLLQACVGITVATPYTHKSEVSTSTAAIRILRLVSKEASRVGL